MYKWERTDSQARRIEAMQTAEQTLCRAIAQRSLYGTGPVPLSVYRTAAA
jgi:predicted exporter